MELTSPAPVRGAALRVSLTVRQRDNLLVVAGELDMATAPRLDRVLRRLESAGQPLCLDLADVTFVDCGGWKVVEDAVARRHLESSPEIQILRLSRQVRRLASLLAATSPGSRAPAGAF